MIVFLDIDGILMTPASYEISKGEMIFEQSAVEYLNQFLDKINPDVVISSTLRERFSVTDLKVMFKRNGVHANIIDKTPWLREGMWEEPRGIEIIDWIESHGGDPETEDFLVIDDDDSRGCISNYIPRNKFVHVAGGWRNGGFGPEHLEDALLKTM